MAKWLSLILTRDVRNTELLVQRPTRAIDASKVDWDVVRNWLCDCDAMHPACTVNDLDEQPLPGFQVIDYKTWDITPSSSYCKYAALSYVWGLSGCAQDHFHQELKHQAPQTIKDAILCTQALGLQ